MADTESHGEAVAHDDLCPVCHLLLFAPVRTQCNHLLCASCMAQWVDASSLTHVVPLHLDVNPDDIDINRHPATSSPNLEANCPMCRTATAATLDYDFAETLQERYPATWEERRVEEDEVRIGQAGIEGFTILIGNKHTLVLTEGSDNKHDWTFFVKCSRPDIVQQVVVKLHPTFNPPQLTFSNPPYEVRRLGWGYFNIEAKVLLKSPYRWITSGSVGPDVLTLDWMLNFEGSGALGIARAKVKKARGQRRRVDDR